MPTTESVWRTQFNALAAELLPWVFELDRGKFVREDAPPALLDAYSRMLTVGYANGWVE